MPDVITGPSGGVLGKDGGPVTAETVRKHPDLAKQIVQIGNYPRAGHDRERWKTVNWDDYRAKVGVCQRRGAWSAEARISNPDGGDPGSMVSRWIEEAQGMPICPPGVYTALMHDERGLVMSDVPAEIAGALPFLDYVADDLWQPPEAPRYARPRVLIAGLGLGIVPAWLLTYTDVARIDVIEIDTDVISLITGDECAREQWAADPRLHVHQGDAHTWWPGKADSATARVGCSLHGDCLLMPRATWDAAFLDVWDTVSPANLPSMHRLTRRFTRRCGRIWSWERAECEAMRARGQTLERPWPCFVSGTGYPTGEDTGG